MHLTWIAPPFPAHVLRPAVSRPLQGLLLRPDVGLQLLPDDYRLLSLLKCAFPEFEFSGGGLYPGFQFGELAMALPRLVELLLVCLIAIAGREALQGLLSVFKIVQCLRQVLAAGA